MKKIMVIVAHPDDAELYAYGMISKLIKCGNRVHVLIMTAGEAGNGIDKEETENFRKKEASRVANKLGYTYEFANFNDGELLPSLQIREFLIKKIRIIKPDIIMTHKDNDYHPDHRYTSIAIKDCLIALRNQAICSDFLALNYTPIVLFFWNRFSYPQKSEAEIIVKIDDCIERKIECLMQYNSQFNDKNEVISLVYGEACEIAKQYHNELDNKYAENVCYAEALELCEYACIEDLIEFKNNINQFFPF